MKIFFIKTKPYSIKETKRYELYFVKCQKYLSSLDMSYCVYVFCVYVSYDDLCVYVFCVYVTYEDLCVYVFCVYVSYDDLCYTNP